MGLETAVHCNNIRYFSRVLWPILEKRNDILQILLRTDLEQIG